MACSAVPEAPLFDLGAVADAASSCVFHGGEIALYSGDEDGVGTRWTVRLRGRGRPSAVPGVAIPDVVSCCRDAVASA
jgi:hypothetical protein